MNIALPQHAPSGAARQESLREHNLRLVLGCVAEAQSAGNEEFSRANIAAQTGLTRGAVSDLVDRLINAGLLEQGEPASRASSGRPAVPLFIAERSLAALGVEINVSALSVCALDLRGEVLAQQSRPGDYRRSNPKLVLAQVAELAAKVCAELDPTIPVIGAAVAVPGLVDDRTGPLRIAPNLGWQDLDLRAELQNYSALAKLPLIVGNEADYAARAEQIVRPQTSEFIYVSGEVGIGATAVLDSQVWVGRRGWAGELGHMVVDPAGPACTCGAVGCLEQFAGRDAIYRAAGLPLDSDFSTLLDLVERKDEAALRAVKSAAGRLGQALAGYVNLVDVSLVVLGGMFAPLAEQLIPIISEQLELQVLWAPWQQVTVARAATWPQAAMHGAAHQVLGEVFANPTTYLELDTADRNY